MRTEPRRLVPAAISIVLGVAFLTMALVVGASFDATLSHAARTSVGDASVVVTRGDRGPEIPLTTPDAVRRLPGVAAVGTEVDGVLQQELPGRTGVLLAHTVPALGGTTTLVAGRLPAASGEVAVNQVAADTRNITPGQQVRLMTHDGTVGVRVVGVVKAGPEVSPTTSMPMLFASDADLLTWLDIAGYTALYVSGTGDPDALAAAVSAAAPGATVRPAASEIAHRIKENTRGTEQITALFSGFGGIALFVTALVITNTFAILVAQRTRELALLRCVGSTRGQVFRGVILESLRVGAVGSAVGVLLGIGATAALARVGASLGLPLTQVAVTPVAVTVPLVAGVLLTMAAALQPARHATAVAPLAALRPRPVEAGRRTGRVRLAVGVGAVAAGAALLTHGAVAPALPTGAAGGLVSFIGVLVLAPVVVPALAGLLGAAARGTTGKLAVENSRRNPRRAAATSAALLVGVTLITMMGVGAETGRATIDAELARQYPADVLVQPRSGLTPAIRERLDTTPGVAGWTEALDLGVRRGDRDLEVTALGPDAVTVLRDRAATAGLAEGVALVPAKAAAEGEMLTLAYGDNTVVLRAHVTGGLSGRTVISLADGRRLAGPDAPATALVTFAPGVNGTAATEDLANRVAQVSPGSLVVSGAAQRQEMQAMVDTVLLVAVGLLAVAVVIALVGVGNTLGLSVLERTQETGLLRALGLTRGQVRTMLGVEALTLAGVAIVLGLGLGVAYGVAGMAAVLDGQVPLVVSIPWLRLAVAAAVALAAGWLASVVPGARAARVSPAAALAYE